MRQGEYKRSNKRLYLLLLALALGIVGLYSWLFESELQAALLAFVEQRFNVYYPDLTGFAATVVLVVVPLYFSRRAPSMHEHELRYEELVKKLKTQITLVALSVLVLASSSWAVYQMYVDAPGVDQEITRVDLSDNSPSFVWLKKVSLNGVPLEKNATFSKDLRQESAIALRRYTPIAAELNSDQPIRFVESFTSDSTQELKRIRASLDGYVNVRLLPAAIRSTFEADGLSMARVVYVIEDRFFDIKPYLKWSSLGLLLLALLFLIRLVLSPRIHRRKLQETWDFEKGYSKNKNVADDIAPWA